jgi:hypothetical protein
VRREIDQSSGGLTEAVHKQRQMAAVVRSEVFVR